MGRIEADGDHAAEWPWKRTICNNIINVAQRYNYIAIVLVDCLYTMQLFFPRYWITRTNKLLAQIHVIGE